MYSHSTLTKVLMFCAVIAAAIYGVNRWNTAQMEKYHDVVAAINEVASIVRESGGQEPERIAAALTPIEEVNAAIIERALKDIEDGYAEYVAGELVLLRMYDMYPKAFVQSGIIRRANISKNYPWTIEGGSATLEAFEVKPEAPLKVKYLFETYSTQGSARKRWK